MKVSKALSLAMLVTLAACGQSNQATSTSSNEVKAANYVNAKSENCQTDNCLALRKEFDHVVSVGKKIYAYWDLKKATTGKDYTQVAKDLKNTITDSTTTYEYYLILQRWAGSLQDGHVNAMWGSDQRELESYKVPLRLELLAPDSDKETLIVSSNAADTKQIPVGAIVTKINGDDAMARLNEAAQYASGSTLRMKRSSAANLLFSIMKNREEEKSPVKIEYTFKDKTYTATLPRLITLPHNQQGNGVPTPVVYSDIVQAKILPNNIGYLRIDSFVGDELATVLANTAKLLINTKALIIDVRRNGGGNQAGDAIIAFLAKDKVIRYIESYRVSDLMLQDRTYKFLPLDFNEDDAFAPQSPLMVTPAKKTYQQKAYVLTSSNCFSACDTFVSALKENKLATIMGEGTGGGTGSPYVFGLQQSGLQFRYSVVQGFTAVNKKLLEGTGTLPDIEIRPTIEERIAGEDQQLVKAVNIVASNIEAEAVTSDELKEAGIKADTPKDSYTLFDYDAEVKLQTEL